MEDGWSRWPAAKAGVIRLDAVISYVVCAIKQFKYVALSRVRIVLFARVLRNGWVERKLRQAATARDVI